MSVMGTPPDREALAAHRCSARSPARPIMAGVRSWGIRGFPNHLIFYRPTDDRIEVIRVLHAARDIETILGREGRCRSM